jgi:type II secretory pathway predicted ATPase ExeA
MKTSKKLHSQFGLKWNPFLAEVPTEALVLDDTTKRFCWRVEQVVMDGGFAMITGEPGTGKSVTLRHLNDHLSNMQELAVRVITRPQSGIRDFYRELAELFEVPIRQNNRYGSFINLRKQWGSHIKSSLFRPVLLMDEAQEAHEDVLNELRLLSSVDLDSKNILAVVFAGDHRLPEKLRAPMLMPLESRIRIRQHLDKRPPQDLATILKETLTKAGNSSLMTENVIQSAAEHAMGNMRAMMMIGNELLCQASEDNETEINENMFFRVFKETTKKRKSSR